jgi:sporulation protein YlmC with PRC-barrel domain
MITRRFILAGTVLAAIVPALAQDAAEITASVPLRATGATYPARQDTGQWLGSNLIGAKVVSASNETIGRIANLVINNDGAIESVVIAVGGVLGVGAKEVAVTYRSLNIVRTKTGDAIDHVTLAASKSDMRHAAEFKTLSRQMAERDTRR